MGAATLEWLDVIDDVPLGMLPSSCWLSGRDGWPGTPSEPPGSVSGQPSVPFLYGRSARDSERRTGKGFRVSASSLSAGLHKKTARTLHAAAAPLRAHLTRVIALSLYAAVHPLRARVNKRIGKGLRAVLHTLRAVLTGFRARLVALQSADDTLFVIRELRSLPVPAEERTYTIHRENRGLTATKES
jgi:hypothetical protein